MEGHESNVAVRPSVWRALAIGMAVLLVGSVVWGAAQMRAKRQAEIALGNRYDQQFFDAVSHVDNVQAILGKALISTQPQQDVALLSDLWRHSYAAQADLSQLPTAPGRVQNAVKFLNQVGDFSFTLARQSASGKPPSDADRNRLQQLDREAQSLAASLQAMSKQAADGKLSFSRPTVSASLFGLRWPWGQSRPVAPDQFSQVDQQTRDFKSLIYDGPFSDDVSTQSPRGLTGDTVSLAQAEQVAARFVLGSDARGYDLRRVADADSGGKIAAYGLNFQGAKGVSGENTAGLAGSRIDVSKKGGHVLLFLNDRAVTRASLSLKDATDRAAAFLKSRGYKDMAPTFAAASNNRATIPFVWTSDGVRVYPDMVKVTVALDNGQIVGFDGFGYVMSHHDRQLPKPKITADEGKNSLDPGFKLKRDPVLALIPIGKSSEVLTWEYYGTAGGREYYVYVNAQDGRQERILQLAKSAAGTMAL
ncbi:MAG TPA: germination protein YpeB [Limnochordia bacterium]|nr:germination protein YpeB [Limnochordia bacterium]